MEKIKQYILKKGDQEFGVLWTDIENNILTPNEYKRFCEWMRGQTVGIVPGLDVSVVYTGDLLRFLKGLPVID